LIEAGSLESTPTLLTDSLEIVQGIEIDSLEVIASEATATDSLEVITSEVTATDSLYLKDTTNFEGFFSYCELLDNITGIENWDTSQVTNMKSMFKSATSFNQDIGDWNVSNVTNMRGLFQGCGNFN